MPPNGAVRSRTRNVFTQTVPARTRGRRGRRARPSRCRGSPRGRSGSSSRARPPRLRPRRSGSVSTGPNTSRWTISLSFERGRDERRLVPEPAELGGPAAADDLVAGGACALDEARRRARGGRGGSAARPWWRRRVGRRGRARREAVEQLEERSAATGSSTSSRVPARQTCPASSYWPAALRAAASRSASAKTTSGPLPPSSAVNGTRFAAAAGCDQAPGLGRAGERDPADARDRRRAPRRLPRRSPGRR